MYGRLTIGYRQEQIAGFFITGIHKCIFIKKKPGVSPPAAGISAQIKYLVGRDGYFLKWRLPDSLFAKGFPQAQQHNTKKNQAEAVLCIR